MRAGRAWKKHASSSRSVEGAVEIRSGTESTLKHSRKSIEDDIAICPDSERAARDASLVTDVATCRNGPSNRRYPCFRPSGRRHPMPQRSSGERFAASGLEQALENRKNDLIQLEREIGRLTGQIKPLAAMAWARLWLPRKNSWLWLSGCGRVSKNGFATLNCCVIRSRLPE